MDKNSVNVRIVLKDYMTDEIWNSASKLLQRVIDRGSNEVLLERIKARILEGSELLLCAFYKDEIIACCILGITDFETGKRALQIPYVAGDHIDSWIEEGFDIIRNLARAERCTHIKGNGRVGWEKAFPEMRRVSVIYECEV